MTTNQKIARRKLSLLELAADLGNVSKACKVMGYSRQQFYEIRRNFQTHGADGLLDRVAGPRNPHPNRVPEAVEHAVLEHALYQVSWIMTRAGFPKRLGCDSSWQTREVCHADCSSV